MTTPDAVFIGDPNSVFVTRTRDALSLRGISVVIVSTQHSETCWPVGRLLNKIVGMYQRFRHIKNEIKKLPRESTAVVHFLSVDVFWLIPLLKRHFIKVSGIAYGSDILRRTPSIDWFFARGLKQLDQIAATNDNVLNMILSDFPFMQQTEHSIVRFGLPVFDAIDEIGKMSPQEARSQLGYDPDKALVSLGYSASLGQRQIELITHFTAQSEYFHHANFVIPIQYGPSAVCNRVIDACEEANKRSTGPRFHPLTEFHDAKKAALLRRATTALINHSVSDAFSGTVQETVYAGSLVLACSQLPYETMPGFGTAIQPYSQVSDTISILSEGSIESWTNEIQTSLELVQKELRNLSSWDAVIDDWKFLIASRPSD